MNHQQFVAMATVTIAVLSVLSGFTAWRLDVASQEGRTTKLAVAVLAEQVRSLRKARAQCVEDAGRQCLKNQRDCEEAVSSMRHELAACRSRLQEDR